MSRVGKSFAPPILAIGLLLAGCHPTGVEYISDLDVVATTHDATFNFTTPNTYSLPNAVYLVEGDPTVTPPARVDPVLEQLILTTLKTEMDASGYTQVPVGQSPDLAVDAAALKVTNVNYYYGYWCTYWTYYGCYPYYPPVVGVSTYVVGTLLVDMVPFSATPPGNQYKGVWTAVIRGIETGSKSTDQQRVVNGISQAFIQSPYLGKP
ncbi:MAG TPA: DUF4136 domain-containing protein [Myxococcaceae bacterium]|nr:DUF4136 domain-containing protein [Myxococcaceae bacterium]